MVQDQIIGAISLNTAISSETAIAVFCNWTRLQSRTVKVNQRRNSINSDHLKAPTT